MSVALEAVSLSTAWQTATRKRQNLALTGVLVLITLGVARLVLYMDLGAVYTLILALTFFAILIQPRYGLYALFGVALFFESGNGPENPFQYPGFFLTASPQTTLSFSGVVFTPIEMYLL